MKRQVDHREVTASRARTTTTRSHPVIITAKYAAFCACCNSAIVAGSKIEWSKGAKPVHAACAGLPATTAARVVSRPGYQGRFTRRGPGAVSAAAVPGYSTSVPGYSSYCTDRAGCRCYDCQ